MTTNLDAQRTAIWDMGRIASSGNPKALDLFRKVMEASASIPGIFSPVLIDVESDGKNFAEMHVDGGVTANIMVVPEAILVANKAALPQSVRPKVYIVINGKLDPYFEVVKPRTLQIAIRSFETSVRANTRNALLATYEFAKRRTWQVSIAAIEDTRAEPGQARLRHDLYAHACSNTATSAERADRCGSRPRPRRSSGSARRAWRRASSKKSYRAGTPGRASPGSGYQVHALDQSGGRHKRPPISSP